MTNRHLSACLLLAVVCSTAWRGEATPALADERDFRASWPAKLDRTWIGPQFWANRLQDWRLREGRLECVTPGRRMPFRTVHLLTHRLGKKSGKFEISVRCGAMGGRAAADSFAGFLVGAGGAAMDYRAAAIVQSAPGPGAGILAGVDGSGRLVLKDFERAGAKKKRKKKQTASAVQAEVQLRLMGETVGNQFKLTLTAHDAGGGKKLGEKSLAVPAPRVVGNVALVSHPGDGAATRHWFRDWTLAAEKVDFDPNRTFGPIACTQYTLSGTGGRAVLKLTAQLTPIADSQPRTVQLEVKQDGAWKQIAQTKIVTPGWTASFRVPDWDATKDTPFAVRYGEDGRWEGVVRRDPIDKETIVVAGFTGNHNCRHGLGRNGYNFVTGMWFPHADMTRQVVKHKPDVLFFSGDQIYEGSSPTYADRGGQPSMYLDYMYKWYLWCWAYRDLARDIPCICIPDDHDVYQGNIWGEGGRKSPGRDHHGGYVHPAEFVKMVERTQTGHLPDPFDPTPAGQGIGVYYCPMTYGRISFAVIEDRKFKSGCARGDMPPSGTGRPDHFNDPQFDIKKLDIPTVKLLGGRQLKFLRHWSADWKGADMKIALSQTHFANMATHHGGGLTYLRADLDSNGWPQTGRAKALDALRRGFAFHLAGDQHLASLIQHGIKEHGDAIWAMTVPSIANFYPRAWAPKNTGKYEFPAVKDYTGDLYDGLMNPVTVHAASNPGRPTGFNPPELHDRMPGYGIIKMNKTNRTYLAECWPRYADPNNPNHKQYPGWPRTINQLDNYGRKPVAHLPTLEITGAKDPVVQVIDEGNGEVLYTLRIKGASFRPKVFGKGSYTIKVNDKVLRGVKPAEKGRLEVKL